MAKTYADYSLYQKIRDEKNLTDYAVAEGSAIAAATISNWKAGNYLPKIDKLMKIACFLDVPLESLLRTEE